MVATGTIRAQQQTARRAQQVLLAQTGAVALEVVAEAEAETTFLSQVPGARAAQAARVAMA
jgi:hypothetical protein